MNQHHKIALLTIGCAAVVDLGAGVAFGFVDHIGVGNGVYLTTAIGTTSGYAVGDQGQNFGVHGWLAHTLLVLVFITLIPMYTAAFSLFTSGLTAAHVRASEARMRKHVEQQFTDHRKKLREGASG